MQLTDAQKQMVATWIADGMKLSDIQVKLANDFDVRLTYMDTRLLVDDLKLTPKDPEPEVKPAPPEEPVEAAQPAEPSPLDPDAAPSTGGITLTTDTIARPGTMVSGKVTFSDGKQATWYLDQTGRLGVVPEEQGYRPPTGDVEKFQAALDGELQKMGY